ncbi:MAG: ImmA/IrrE family metallo-endopeptidase [Pseudoclavibacter sp.]
MTNWEPFDYASELGISVQFCGELGGDLGRWYPEQGTILILDSLPFFVERSVLAHEIAHAVLGHETTTPKTERQADRWAARRLISVEDFRTVAARSPDPGQWCVDLQVTPRLLVTAADLYASRRHARHDAATSDAGLTG